MSQEQLREALESVRVSLEFGTITGWTPGQCVNALAFVRTALATQPEQIVAPSIHEQDAKAYKSILDEARAALGLSDGDSLVAAIERLATQPEQAKGGEAVAGELDPRRSYEFGQLITKYSESFNGQNWDSVCDSVDRKNLAVALDHLTEAGAMLMNISERLLRTHPAPAASVSDEHAALARSILPVLSKERIARVFGRLEEGLCKHEERMAREIEQAAVAQTIAILALRPAQAGVPEGWKLVPVEPTQAMCQEGQWKAKEWPKFPLRITAIWQAMLAAAPKEGGAV